MSYDNANPEPSGGQSASANSSRAASRDGRQEKMHDCPICGRQFRRLETKTMPFCGPRCQQVDLGRWFNESYGFPYEGTDRPEGTEPSHDE